MGYRNHPIRILLPEKKFDKNGNLILWTETNPYVRRHNFQLGQVSAVFPILQPSVGEAILTFPRAEAEQNKPRLNPEEDNLLGLTLGGCIL